MPHLLDALALAADVRESLVDVGSGGGLPGIPLGSSDGACRRADRADGEKSAFFSSAPCENAASPARCWPNAPKSPLATPLPRAVRLRHGARGLERADGRRTDGAVPPPGRPGVASAGPDRGARAPGARGCRPNARRGARRGALAGRGHAGHFRAREAPADRARASRAATASPKSAHYASTGERFRTVEPNCHPERSEA